ncbi:MAG: universal stress protein [Chloroflexi bacterium]|nr:universal stress protein [Chloroflexota bacterium]MDA8187859.1 universal stress protein [Dehalococcoidales bacterium]
MKISRLLVPVSGSSADKQAIQLACSSAKRYKAKVYVVYVIEVKRTLPLDAELEPEIQKGEAVLDAAERSASEADYRIETEILQAREVGPAVVDEAVERAVDVIVVGVSYQKKFGEFTLGKTADYVLKNAPCWVWVCREPIQSS